MLQVVVDLEDQLSSKELSYTYSSGVFLSIQLRCRCISMSYHCRVKSFLPKLQYSIEYEITVYDVPCIRKTFDKGPATICTNFFEMADYG